MSGVNKSPKKKEPKQLVRGKKFHKKLQEDWKKAAEDQEVTPEERITKPSGRKGRIDVFVDASDEKDKNLVAVVEIKASNWDRMTLKALRRNVARQASQIWDYIESQLEQGKDVSPGVILKERPKDPERLELIEQLFDERGIPVVWEDVSIKGKKVRS